MAKDATIKKYEESKEANLLLNKAQINSKVKKLAQEISKDYLNKCPIIIGVLNGSFIFLADLVRQLTIDCEIDFVKISSYGDGKQTSGKVKMLKDADAHIEGRDIIIVEDIVDSGYSLRFLREHFKKHNPASLKYVALLVKKGAAKVDYSVEYKGFEIPNRFVVGYGLDKGQILRNLPAIYTLDE